VAQIKRRAVPGLYLKSLSA